jgi:hypothetical protein
VGLLKAGWTCPAGDHLAAGELDRVAAAIRWADRPAAAVSYRLSVRQSSIGSKSVPIDEMRAISLCLELRFLRDGLQDAMKWQSIVSVESVLIDPRCPIFFGREVGFTGAPNVQWHLVILFSVDTIARQSKAAREASVDDYKAFLKYLVGTCNRAEPVKRFSRYDFFTRFRSICRSYAGLIVNNGESVTHLF